MPPTLHPCLKRGLHLDALPIDRNDLVEDVPAEYHDAQHQSAKRRRVETIALQYLRGKRPVILTASLKGPFTKEWKNPWTNRVKARPNAQKEQEGHGKARSKALQVASPEASRAAAYDEDLMYSQSELAPLPATAPLPDEHDTSGATEFFSINTEQFVANHSPANPFWLRRPAASVTFPANSQTDKTPTKKHNERPDLGNRQDLQFAQLKRLLGRHLSPSCVARPNDWQSSASAPMDISSCEKKATMGTHSPAQDPSQTQQSSDIPDSSRLRADSAQEEEARSSQAGQNAQTIMAAETPSKPQKDLMTTSSQGIPERSRDMNSFEVLVPATTYKTPATEQMPQPSPTRESPSGTLRQSSSATCKTSGKDAVPGRLRHDMVTSPAPASSTGFAYRRICNKMPKTKPRVVSFSSSPTFKKKAGDSTIADVEAPTLAVEAEAFQQGMSDAVAGVTDGDVNQENNEQEAEGHEAQQHADGESHEEQQDSHRSKQSQYSTQAAMLLAQLEFQEDLSQSSTSSATLRPWSQPAQNTPPPVLLQPSPAITPLSVFNARLDDSLGDVSGASVLHAPFVSTQDLFNAASPFAFSTVKKKSERSRRSSVRFTMASRFAGSVTAKSPTPSAERVPLKEKNISKLWSFTHDKSSVDSPKLTSQSPRRDTNDVELPQLDFHTSLDDFGPNADIHFTDCFLKGLNGT
ncbi:hypothetical protein N0V94_000233 [Neodidymelliopsis sp. IMI 364377]|nr:hypothetical protein N0V94_000233 [Neodidymelliopsis sp. IMI 364377]